MNVGDILDELNLDGRYKASDVNEIKGETEEDPAHDVP